MHADLKEQLDALPTAPGVYRFYDKAGDLLYVGKAAVLRHRVRQYFHDGYAQHNAAKRKMIDEIHTVDWKETDSEIEALVYEARAIKQHQPRYNVLLRDDKHYFWVLFSDDPFPRIRLTHQVNADQPPETNPRYGPLGPFTDGRALKKTLRLLREIFPYCTCKQMHKRPCLNAQMERCPGYCCYDNDGKNNERRTQKEQYLNTIRAIRRVLMGRSKTLLDELQNRMNKAAERKDFEEAATIRDRRDALQTVLDHSHVLGAPVVTRPRRHEQSLQQLKVAFDLDRLPRRIEAYDVANLKKDAPTAGMVVATNGRMNPSAYRQFHLATAEDDVAGIHEVLDRRLRHDEWPLPDLILVDGGIPQRNAAQSALEKQNADIALAALAKQDETLYRTNSNEPLSLADLNDDAAYLLQHLRDEAHRFARRLHHTQRSKALTE